MVSIFDDDIINIISQYSAEEYIINDVNTEIITSIKLCNVCLQFADFKPIHLKCFLSINNIGINEEKDLEIKLHNSRIRNNNFLGLNNERILKLLLKYPNGLSESAKEFKSIIIRLKEIKNIKLSYYNE